MLDTFETALDTNVWATTDPVGDCTVSTTGTQLSIAVPSGVEHDLWTGANNACRVMQAAADADFWLEAKFDTVLDTDAQLNGIIVEASAGNLIRFDVFHDGTNLRAFSATMTAGTATQRHNAIITAGFPVWLRVQRVSDDWLFWHSYDGLAWVLDTSYTHALTVATVGVFAGNAATNPALTSLIDYFDYRTPVVGIANLRLIDKTPTSVTIDVDTDQQEDFVTVALRDTSTWLISEKQDIIDGLGDQNEEQVSKATNRFVFSGLAPSTPYYIGAAAYSSDVTPPPPDPPAEGGVPQPTGLTFTNRTTTSITLDWTSPENPDPAGLYRDYSADIEALSDGDAFPENTFVPSYETEAGLLSDRANIEHLAKASNEVGGRFATRPQLALKFSIYLNTNTDFRNRQEVQPRNANGVDKYRFRRNVKQGWAYSIWSVRRGLLNSFQVKGQVHEQAPPGETGDSPVITYRWNAGEWSYTTYGNHIPIAIQTERLGIGNIQHSKTPFDPDEMCGRWQDIVWLWTYDPDGANNWPQDGAAPYNGHLECWVDGVKKINYFDGGFGSNDEELKPGHYPKFGIYSGFKARNLSNPPAGGWGDTTQIAYYSGVRIAEGEFATYENLNAAGRVTAIEIQQETAPNNWSVVKTLPPSYNSFTVSGLTPATQYKFRVRCRFNAETSTPTGTLTVSTL